MKYAFANVFNSFIPVVMLKKLRFKSSVLFGTHVANICPGEDVLKTS